MKQVYNYKEVQKELLSKKVRTGNDETFTPVDYITDEQLEEINRQGITNLTPYIPLPEHVRKHDGFVNKIFEELISKYPNDEFLQFLDKEENLETLYSYSWYEKYGIKYE